MTSSPGDRFHDDVERYRRETQLALNMGGAEKLARRRVQGVLNARERVECLVDPDSFVEVGRFAVSARPGYAERTPADAKVCGYATIEGRPVTIISNDFTVLGASSTGVNRAKIRHMKDIATDRGLPMIFLGESSGARLPDSMGSGMALLGYQHQYLRDRTTPWVSAVLGYCYGSSALYGAMADFNVMRKGAVMSLSSPTLLQLATGEAVEAEALGGWRVHAEVTGLADLVVDTDAEALQAVRRFLAYLPSHNNAPPPEVAPPSQPDWCEEILDVIPESPTKVYDVRKIIRLVTDAGSVFELKPHFGRNAVTALARLDGRSVGIVANNPLHKGGALDVDASQKITDFLVLCDSYNIPLVLLVDQPGFLVGMEQERRALPAKVINWMNALSLCSVPKLSVILRKSYGQAYLNMGGAGNADEVAAWWSADVSFMDPRSAVAVSSRLTADRDPEAFQEAVERMGEGNSAYDLAQVFGVHAVIDPRETRGYLRQILNAQRAGRTGGISRHLLRYWPTSS